MAEPKRIRVKLSFDVATPIRVHTDLSMFAQTTVKKTPDREKIEKMRKLSKGFLLDRKKFSQFVEAEN